MRKVFLVLFFMFLLVSCGNNDYNSDVNGEKGNGDSNVEEPKNSLKDGPGSPMLRYTGKLDDACNHAKFYGFNSIVVLINSNDVVSEVGYRADITEKKFYEDFEICIYNSNVPVTIISKNYDSNDNYEIEYCLHVDLYNNTIVTLRINSKIYSEVKFERVFENVDNQILLDFVKESVGMRKL